MGPEERMQDYLCGIEFETTSTNYCQANIKIYYQEDIDKLNEQLQQYKQQIDELVKWLELEIAKLDIELGNTFGTHGIIVKEKYDLRDAYIKVLSKLKERNEE